jgi:hypothetical protein
MQSHIRRKPPFKLWQWLVVKVKAKYVLSYRTLGAVQDHSVRYGGLARAVIAANAAKYWDSRVIQLNASQLEYSTRQEKIYPMSSLRNAASRIEKKIAQYEGQA